MLEFQNRTALEKEIEQQKKKCTLFSALRTVLMICVIVFLLCLLSLTEYVLYGILTGVFFAVFLIVVILSEPVYRKNNHLKNKQLVYEKHIQRREKKFSHFGDQGTEFKRKDDYKLSDLDVFGSKSLYQYLSEAKTPMGRELLARQLSNPDSMDSDFTSFVYDMASEEKTLDLESVLMEFKKGTISASTDEFTSLVADKRVFQWRVILPILSFLLMVVYLCIMIPLKLNFYVPLLYLVINFVLAKVLCADSLFQKDVGSYYYLANLYYELAEGVSKTDIHHPYYEGLKKNITQDLKTLKRIKSVYRGLRIRRNVILNILLNSFLSFDAFLSVVLYFKMKNGLKVDKSLESIAKLELALSFKNIGMDNEVYSIPEAAEQIEAVDMQHCFVKNCVPNSITLDGGIVLTGSNMSGKTTFMRVLGLCTLLKNAGSIVPAKVFKAPKMAVYTSLRANDMLQEGVSTFYAEIQRMKAINEAIHKEKCLVLVDEIFKGTNAMERISASKKVIEKLNEYHAIFVVSTHDFEICDTENITNYHFEESYEDDKISFDYTLKSGAGTKGNALYLLKMSGIIE